MELKNGKMTTKELATWFGIAYSTFRKKKTVLLEELNDYCRFTLHHGYINITDIFIKEYVNPKQKNYKIVESHVDEEWDESGLDTKINVSKKIYSKYQNELSIKPTTTYNYVRKASNTLWGPANDYEQSGTLGNCWYKLCIIKEDGNRRLLTEEEEEIRKKIRRKYCSDEEKEKREELEDVLRIKFKRGDISETYYHEQRAILDGWRDSYLIEFENTLKANETLGYGTFKYNFKTQEIEESAFE